MSFYHESKHKSRKVRRCEGCWFKTDTNPIQIGQEYWSIYSADGGDFGVYALCTECRDFLESPDGKKFMAECVDGWNRGDVAEARRWQAINAKTVEAKA